MECCSLRYIDTLDFDHLLQVARKRFVEGVSTMELLQGAVSNREKEQVTLVALLDVGVNFSLVMHGGDAGAWSLDDIRQLVAEQGIDPAAAR